MYALVKVIRDQNGVQAQVTLGERAEQLWSIAAEQVRDYLRQILTSNLSGDEDVEYAKELSIIANDERLAREWSQDKTRVNIGEPRGVLGGYIDYDVVIPTNA